MVVIQEACVELLPFSFVAWEGRAKVGAFFGSSLREASEGVVNTQFRGHLLHAANPPFALESAGLEGLVVEEGSNSESSAKFSHLRVWNEEEQMPEKAHDSLDLLAAFIHFSQSL